MFTPKGQHFFQAHLYLKGFASVLDSPKDAQTPFLQMAGGSDRSPYTITSHTIRHNRNKQNVSEEQKSEIRELSKAVFLNMAVCHIKVDKPDRAIEDCNNVCEAASYPLFKLTHTWVQALALDPQNVKAFFRRGQAYLMKQDVDRAGEDLNRAAKMAPGDKSIQQELRKQKQMEATQTAKQRKAFAGIFDKMSQEDTNEPT